MHGDYSTSWIWIYIYSQDKFYPVTKSYMPELELFSAEISDTLCYTLFIVRVYH